MKPFHTHIEPKVEELINHVELELKNLLGDKLKRIILYGSFSRGDYDDESDIDLIALVEEKQPEEKFKAQILDIMVNLSIEYDRVLSLFLENIDEYEADKHIIPLLKNIEKEGIEIYAA